MTSNKAVRWAVVSLLAVGVLCLSASGEDKHVAESTIDGLMTQIESLENRVTMLEQQCQGATSTNQGERASVIRTAPSRGDNNVSAQKTLEISVTFSKEMG